MRSFERPARRETAFVVAEIRKLLGEGVVPGEVAVLYRTNARSAVYEQALSEAGIAFQVREGGFLRPARRPARALRALRTVRVDPAAVAAERGGGGGARGPRHARPRRRRSASRNRLGRPTSRVSWTSRGAFDDGSARSVADFFADLDERFGPEATSHRRGVQLMTYHRAKGLEFDAVFLPRLEEKDGSRSAGLKELRGDRRGAAALLRGDDARYGAGST